MFVKLHPLDSDRFQLLGSARASRNVVLVVSSPEKSEFIKKHRVQRVPESPNGGVKRFSRVYRQTHYDRRSGAVRKQGLDQHGFAKDHDRRQRRNKGGDGRFTRKRGGVVESKSGDVNDLVEKVSAKCSTKWLCYGGCLPSILQALETEKDLDVALSPWEESLSNKERSIILKEQSCWERALEIFEWLKKKGCYELNVIHYNIMLRILGKARKWNHVESLWDDMMSKGITPVNSTYGTLIDVYSKGGLTEQALHWLDKMNKQGVEPDEVTMGVVVQTYKKAGQFKKAEQFFKNWSLSKTLKDKRQSSGVTTTGTVESAFQPHVCLSSYTYNTLIDTYGKAGQLQAASDTFASMLREGIIPNTVTFNTMIHICGNHGQLEEVALLMQKMEELRCSPDTRTYNILISLHAKHNNIDRAARYFKKMKEAHLEPDLVSYRTLLYAFSIRHMVDEAEILVSEMDERDLEIDEFTQSALTRMYIEAGMLDKSWLWFRRFHLEGTMTSGCYSANIDAYGERGHILQAEKAFLCCKERRKLSVLEFNVMIKAYGISNRYEKACQLINSMENHGVLPDKCTYNSLVQILASTDLPHKAKFYLMQMQKAQLVTDCIPYCAVISSFIKLGQLEMAEELFKEMIGYDVQPDVVTYGVLINAFADVGNVREAMNYVNAMRNAGLPMNVVIYNSLIKLYTKVGYLEEAQEAYKMLEASEAGPDIYSSNCMIDLYSERSMVKQAEEIFESLKRRGDANEFSFAMMLCMYKRTGKFKEAFQIVQKMRELGLVTDLLSYNNVLGLYAMDGRFKDAVGTFKEMIEASIQPDDCTFKSLGAVLVKCGISKQAVGKLEMTRKKDPQNGLQAWTSILSSVVEVDEADTYISCRKPVFQLQSVLANGVMFS